MLLLLLLFGKADSPDVFNVSLSIRGRLLVLLECVESIFGFIL